MSTVAKTQPSVRRQFDLRGYLAGGTVTAALIAAAVVLFASLAAYVAFHGLPVGGGDDAPARIEVDSSSRAPEAAAAALRRAPAAVAAVAVTPAIGGGSAATPAGAGASTASTAPAGSQASTVTPLSPASSRTAQSPSGASPGQQSGTLGGTVNDVDRGTDGIVELPPIEQVTAPIDQTITGGLNQVGGAVLDNPQLGDQVTGTVGSATDGLPGGG